MVLEIWHIVALLLFTATCVLINYTSGFKKGIELTIFGLMESDIIDVKVDNGKLFISSKNGKHIKTVDAVDIIK